MKCTAIVVTYNGIKWYDKCLGNLLQSDFPVDVIVVDNKSTDDTVKYISKNFPRITIVENNVNYGFAIANNIGLKMAYDNNSDFFFLLNQDAWIEKDTIEKLINFSMNNPEYGIISPIHLTGDKRHFDRQFVKYFHDCSETLYAYENLYLKKPEPVCYNSRFVNAASWLITKNCIETVGGFDTIMFRHRGEDANYCHRVLYHNLKIAIVTSTTICHDREFRQDKPQDVNITFSITYANILNKRIFLKRLIKIIVKIASIKLLNNGLKELIYLVLNIHKISKSRKRNKIKGEGLKYILETSETRTLTGLT